MAVRTGTASQIDASAGSSSTSVTVPADATGVVAFSAFYNGSPSADLGNLTLGGITLTEELDANSTLTLNGYRIGTLFSLPGTGSQTFAWTWVTGAPIDEGGEIVLIWLKDLRPGLPIRDVDGVSGSSIASVSLTVDTAPSDLLLQFCESLSPNGPPVGEGTPFINDAVINSHIYDVSQVTPSGGGTTTLNMTGEADSTMLAASFPGTPGVQVPMIHHPVFAGAVG